jgi:hypothetical protein
MDKKLSVIFSSHLSERENNDFIEHVKLTAGNIDLHVHCIPNKRQYSLTEAYNLGWKEINNLGRGNGAIVFCHNDILFRTKDWGKTMIQMLSGSNYSIIGVAGATELNAHGCWWMDATGVNKNDSKMVGRVWHTDGTRDWETAYPNRIGGIRKTIVVDGLFFGIDGSAGLKPFDESFKGFHYYDLSFSFENYLEGFNVGVTDRISIMHRSVGHTNMEWESNRIQFAEKYKDELPVSL